MSRKNIAFLSIHSCPVANPDEQNVGGMNVYVRNIALFLGKLGIKVDILLSENWYDLAHVYEEGDY